MAGKGSKRRPGDEKKFRENWEQIFVNGSNGNSKGNNGNGNNGKKKA